MRHHPPPPRLRAPISLVLLALAVSVLSLLAIDLMWHGPVTAADAGVGWRVVGTVVAVAMVALTALSPVYLGAHCLSDVLAAIAEGVAWLALCFTVTAQWVPNQPGRSAADG